MNEKYLLTPGPVPLPPEVLQAGARQLISHRCPDFSALFMQIEEKLSRLFRSDGPVIILPSSGTGALECMAVNFLDENSQFLSISCGAFGNRFREIAARTGAKGYCVDVSAGEAVTPAIVAKAVAEHPGCSVLLLTQNETSSAVLNPIKEIIAALPTEDKPFVLVDGVSSVGAMACYPQEWSIDAVGTASQKGLMTAPGLGLVWLSQRAWSYIADRQCRSYTYDLKLHRRCLESASLSNPFTPPVSLYYQLNAALDLILAEGTDTWFARRRQYAAVLAARLEALGFELLAKDLSVRSPGVTAFSCPEHDAETIRKHLRAMGIETAGGQEALKGKLIRVAHYNDFGQPELALILGCLKRAVENAEPPVR